MRLGHVPNGPKPLIAIIRKINQAATGPLSLTPFLDCFQKRNQKF